MRTSIEPAAYKDGTRPDLSKETLAGDSAKATVERLTPQGISDETLRRYAHHQDRTVRLLAGGARTLSAHQSHGRTSG